MRPDLFSRLRATSVTAIALVALVLASTGAAVGKPATEPPGGNEVTLVTLTGGPVSTTTPGAQVPIPLNGESTFVFTQKAGEAIELILTANPSGDTATFCDMAAIVYGDGIPLGARVDLFSNKGEVGLGSAIGGLPAPATDTIVTLKAITMESSEFCDGEVPGEPGPADTDTWTVSVRVTIVTLRN
jgi:hypothetical protein